LINIDNVNVCTYRIKRVSEPEVCWKLDDQSCYPSEFMARENAYMTLSCLVGPPIELDSRTDKLTAYQKFGAVREAIHLYSARS